MSSLVLRYTLFSPFSRKVSLLALERGLMQRLTLQPAEVGTHVPLTTAAHDELATYAPLMKIPVLLIDGSTVLYDSRVICEYLDTCHTGASVFPLSDTMRWTALRIQALADGITDAALLCRFESARNPAQQSDEWVNAQTRRILQALDGLDKDVHFLQEPLHIGTISAASALGYLDFRFPHLNWRTGRAALGNWFDIFSQRASMQQTRPAPVVS